MKCILAANPGTRAKRYRKVYQEHKGSIPKGYLVHHVCFEPACINPDHLKAMSKADHVRVHRGREVTLDYSRTFGERIRALRGILEITQRQLADAIGLKNSQRISAIERGLMPGSDIEARLKDYFSRRLPSVNLP